MGNGRNKIILKVGLQSVLLLLCLLVLQPQPMNYAQDFPDVCQESENILQNCDFSQGLNRWEPFLEAGSADISVLQGGGECHAPLCPAAYIVSADHFIGGIKQQVSVEKGRNYYANIVWLVFDSLVNDASINNATGGIGRRIGIDPFGGTDSTSSNVVWSEDNWRNDCKICNVEHVTVTAQADTITVFLRIDDTWKLRAREQGFPLPPSNDKFWIDDIGLKPVGGDPIAVEPEPAPTEEPTEEPTPVPATDTPVPTVEPEAAEPQLVAQAEATEEPEPSDESDEAEEEAEASEEAVDASSIEESAEEATEEPTEEATGEPTDEPEPVIAGPTNTPIPPPPTLTPTHTPPPTATSPPRPSPTLRPAGSSLALAADAEAASALPLSLNTIGMLGCIGGLGLAFVGAMMAGLVWLYRLGWGQKEVDEFESENVYNDDDDDDDDYEYEDEDDYYDDDDDDSDPDEA